MAFYKVGPIHIDCSVLNHYFSPFQVNVVEYPCLKVIETESPFEKLQFVCSNREMELYKNSTGWVYCSTLIDIQVYCDFSYSTCSYYAKELNTWIFTRLFYYILECKLIQEGCLILHSSCIEKDGKAVLFSAPSGTGKSTRSRNWVKELDYTYLSGDRPIIDVSKRKVYGAPWDGKEQVYKNSMANIEAIFYISRSKTTFVQKLSKEEFHSLLMKQIFIPMWDKALVLKAYVLLKQLIQKENVYMLWCDNSKEAAYQTYSILKTYIVKENCIMKMKPNFEIINIGDDYMAVPTGENMTIFGGTVALNAVSAFLLDKLQTEKSEEELVECLLSEYEVSEEVARADVQTIIATFKEIGIVE